MGYRGRVFAAALGLLSPLFTSAAGATLLDTSFTESIYVATGLNRITGMAWAPDGSGRLFLTDKNGQVRIVQDGVLKPTPFAVMDPIFLASECGLVGLAFDPDFATNGYVYFFVTVSSSEQQIIRYTAEGDVGVDRTVIVSGLPTSGRNHDGGAVGFGPDGKLYWAVGDINAGLRLPDDLATLASKIGRAERDGSVPSDNPFFDGDGPNADLAWVRGLRNPFTFTWRPETEALWVNVVGRGYEQILVLGAGDHAGWGLYENTQPEGFVPPLFAYQTRAPTPRTIVANGVVREAGEAVFTTSVPHGFRRGLRVTIAGVANASFNGPALVTGVPSPRSFSIAQPGPDAQSSGGTATAVSIGGCITGGTFLDASSVPAEYRGNFFFGDYVSGRIHRLRLDPATDEVASVDAWAEGVGSAIDMDVGPDGDLYYVNHAGTVFHAAYAAPAPGIVVSRRHLRLNEGGRIAFSVRLATPPSAATDVEIRHASGDADVSAEVAVLTFTRQTWSVPQPVFVLARSDADRVDDVATLRAESPGLTSEDVIARVTDESTEPGEGGAGGAGGAAGAAGAAGAGSGAVAGADGGLAGASGTQGGSGGTADGGAPAESGANQGGSLAGGSDGERGGTAGDNDGPGGSDSGCGCRVGTSSGTLSAALVALLGVLAAGRRRARRRDSALRGDVAAGRSRSA